MRKHLWQVDKVLVDLEDRDVSVSLVHHFTLSEVIVRFRLKPEQLEETGLPLRQRIELLACQIVLDLGSYFDSCPD